MQSKNKEEYLAAVYELEEEGREAKTRDLALRLKVNDASVTEMLKKLSREGYVKYEPYKGVSLTKKGVKTASKIKRKHRILERFLHDILGISKKKVHDQACEMEHVISDEVEDAMEELLDNPKICPDDNKPIPNALRKKTTKKTRTLLNTKTGSVIVVGKLEGGTNFQQKMATLGIRQGKRIKVVAKEPVGGPLVVKIGNTTVTIGRGMARKINVKESLDEIRKKHRKTENG